MFSFCQQISLFSMHCRRISDTISTTFDFFSMRPVFLLCLLFFSCFNFLFYIGKKVKVKVTQSYLTLCDPMDCIVQSWNSLGQNTRVDGISLLQGIFPTQRSNPGLPHCRQILYHQSHQGSPIYLLSPPTETLCTTNFPSSG